MMSTIDDKDVISVKRVVEGYELTVDAGSLIDVADDSGITILCLWHDDLTRMFRMDYKKASGKADASIYQDFKRVYPDLRVEVHLDAGALAEAADGGRVVVLLPESAARAMKQRLDNDIQQEADSRAFDRLMKDYRATTAA